MTHALLFINHDLFLHLHRKTVGKPPPEQGTRHGQRRVRGRERQGEDMLPPDCTDVVESVAETPSLKLRPLSFTPRPSIFCSISWPFLDFLPSVAWGPFFIELPLTTFSGRCHMPVIWGNIQMERRAVRSQLVLALAQTSKIVVGGFSHQGVNHAKQVCIYTTFGVADSL